MDSSRSRGAPTPATIFMGRSSRLARKRRVVPATPMGPSLDQPWMKKMYPLEASELAGRDVFGGHGIFEDMQVYIYSMALFGMLPVSFRPLRVSFHPLRSTLVHCVLVMALVVWSTSRMVSKRFVAGQALDAKNFSNLVTFVHLGGLSMLPLMWIEARHARRNEPLSASIMAQFAYVRRRCRIARAVAACMVVVSVVVSPLMVFVWVKFVSAENVQWSDMVANYIIVQMEISVTCLYFCLFQCLKDFAEDLSTAMVKELSAPYASPCRVVAFRRAWLALRDLTQGLVLMPFTVITMMLFSLLMFTLNAYLCLVSLLDGRFGVASVIFAIGSLFVLQLLIICDAVQRARDAVSKGFLKPLELFCTAVESIDGVTSDEIHNFREIVASSPVIVSAAGFWDIDRHSISSIMATSVGYLIVLIQFRSDPPEFMTSGVRNDTVTTIN